MGIGALEPWHLIIILVIVLLLFGPGKLPQVGKAIGDGLRDFKKATSSDPPAPLASPNGAATPVVSSTAAAPVGGSSATTTVITAAPRAAVCPSCKAPVAASARFCGACGATLAA